MPLTPTEQQEAQLRGAVEKKASTPPPAGSAQERAEKIKEKLEKSPRSATESLVNTPVDRSAVDIKADKNVGFENWNTSGNKTRNKEQRDKIAEVKGSYKLAADILDKGYDALGSAAEKTAARGYIEEILRTTPGGEALLGPVGTPTPNKDEILENVLRSDGFKGALREKMQGSLNGENADLGNLVETKKARDEATETLSAKVAEISKLEGQLTDTQGKLDRFDPTGPDRITLDKLIKDTPKIEGEIGFFEDQTETLKDLVGRIRVKAADEGLKTGTVTTATADELTKSEGQLKKANEELAKRRAQMEEKRRLTELEAQLKQDKNKTEADIDKARSEESQLKINKSSTDADYNLAKLDQKTDEKVFVDSAKGMLREAAKQYVEDQLSESIKADKAMLEEEKKNEVDKDKKAVYDKLERAWLNSYMKKGREHFKINKDKSKEDFGKLIKQGPVKILENVLIEGLDPTNPVDAAEITRIRTRIANDKAFVDEMQPKVVQKLATRYMQSGGKPDEGDLLFLQGTDWGIGMIKKAIEENKSWKDEVTELYGAGALDSSFVDKLKRASNGSFLTLLMLVLGTAAFGAVPIGFALKDALKE